MKRNTEGDLTKNADRRLPGKGLLRAAAAGGLVLLGGLIGGVVVAAQNADGIPTGIWNQHLKFGSNDLLVVFAVDSEGNIKPYFEKDVGKPGSYDPVEDPIHTPWVQMQIGNPKVCWIASDGGQECVTYQ